MTARIHFINVSSRLTLAVALAGSDADLGRLGQPSRPRLEFGANAHRFNTMTTFQTPSSSANLAVTQVLAALLERLDRSAVPVGAEQYRSVVSHLIEAFDAAQPGADLGALLDGYPAAAELYENVHYQHAGLCRSPLDSSLSAEQQAKHAIERAMRQTPKGNTDVQS